MSHEGFTPQAYLKVGCPYSFKFLLFMSESGLLPQIQVNRCDPGDAEAFRQVRQRLAAGTGKPATFPTVETEPGVYRSDSDQLIEYFAARRAVRVETLPALSFYRESIFPQLVELHKHED